MNQDRETLGQLLKRIRELHLVSVQEMARAAGMAESLLSALEDDDFDAFGDRSQAMWLCKHYAAYLDMNEKDVLRRFEWQWKRYGGVKRVPKLSHFADADLAVKNPARLKVKGLPAGVIPKIGVRLPLAVMVVIAGFILFFYLPASRNSVAPPEPLPPSAFEQKTVPPERKQLPPEPETARRDQATTDAAPAVNHPGHFVMERKPPSPGKGIRVVGNSDSKRYHLPGMKFYDQVKAYHRVIFNSEKEAVAAGYRKARQ